MTRHLQLRFMGVTIDTFVYIVGLEWRFETKISFIVHAMNITGEATVNT
jgi:hypothetical protein